MQEGVSSRRMAVLSAHEHGLFTGVTVGLTPGYSPDSAATRPELIASTNARWSRSF
jgi:hypothetical protein